jgi:tRNA(fMet)-specific endonuclease VapC
MIILDTDHISVLQHAESDVANRLNEQVENAGALVVTTSITVEEQCRSWLALINRYSDVGRQVTYYDRFVETIRFFAKWRILPFDAAAADQFNRLRSQRIRIEHPTSKSPQSLWSMVADSSPAICAISRKSLAYVSWIG